MNQRSPSVNIASFTPVSVCFFCDTLRPPITDEMRVVSGSPRKNATLPDTPPFRPVEGFDPIEGAATMKSFLGGGCSSSGRDL